MNKLPIGTVTFLFTDIEGSTQLWEKHPEEMKSVLAKHDSILKEAIEVNQGYIIKTTGDGIHAVFEKAIDAVKATTHAQQSLQSLDSEIQLKVRMGLHTGEAEIRDNDYYGQTLNRTARIMSVGHGNQILISAITADVVREHLPADTSLQDLGDHRLKDLIRPERLYQLNAPDLQREFPALQSLNSLPNNLPLQLTSFIGREREMNEAHKLLSSTRLLTFIGPGGTGKTRLSLQVAAEQLSEFKDGVWFFELAPIADPSLILTTIASVFDLREGQNIPMINILIDYLRAKQVLLILDNCEHIVEASAQIANQILHGCPQLRIIASSREALGIDGETVYRVPSLLDDEATRLFVERGAKADSRFKLTEHNASSVTQICSRLDGIPLAIELAAARVKIFTPEQIAERLDDRFKLLTGGSRTALPRQQTLRALIDWSYQSLNEMEQRALCRLAVFSGGWTIEAAEAVIGQEEALDSLLGLVNKSLVNVEEQNGESRYRFLETIRQYAMEKLLESGEAVDARNRHLDYMISLGEKSEQRMFGSESMEWLNQMELEHDNLRAALEWSTSNDLNKAIKLALGAGAFWTSRDYNSEARSWCRTILERSESLPNMVQSDRAMVYAIWGWACITTGNHKEGRAATEAGLPLARQTNDTRTIVHLLIIAGLSSLFIGDYETALQAPKEASELARQMGYKGELSLALTAQAQASFYTTRDLALSKKYLDEATALGNEGGFKWATAMSAYGRGRLAANMGDLEAARERLIESAEISKKFGNKRIFFSSRSELAHVMREHGQLKEAMDIYKEVLPGWKELGHRAAIAHELECVGYILIKWEKAENATTLFGAAEALREVIDTYMTNIEQDEYNKEISILRTGMDEAEFDQLWKKGRMLTMDEAIDLALSI